MPKSHTNIEYFTKGGRKYKNTYENLNPPQKTSFVPRERNRRCKSLTYFTRLGKKTPDVKNAFSKEDLDNYSPLPHSLRNYNNNLNNGNDEIFYYTSFPLIIECNKTNIPSHDKLDKYLDCNENFKLPPLNSLYIDGKNEKKKQINKIPLYKNKIPSREKINSKKIDTEIENELRRNKKLLNDRKYYMCEEENIIDRDIIIKENRRIQKLDTQIDEILHIIDRNKSEKKVQPQVTEFYCSKKKYKPSVRGLVQRYNV